ncbi:MAG: replicative DNA helicase [Ignavibacteria bacterium]
MTKSKTPKQEEQKSEVAELTKAFAGVSGIPEAVDLERIVICSVIIDNNVLGDIINILNSSHFYDRKNSIIFRAMESLYSKNEVIDIYSLREELKRMNKFDKDVDLEYIVSLADSTTTSANAEYYAKIIYEKYILRSLIYISHEISQKSRDPSVNTYSVLNEAERRILEISESLAKKRVLSVRDELEGFIKMLGEAMSREKKAITGVPTGFTKLDDLTSGFQKSELIIIAGRPSHGKTAFALNIARNAAARNMSVAVFSLEMSFRELMLRLLASEAGVDGRKLKTGRLPQSDWERVLKTYHRLKTNLFIDDSSDLGVLELRAKARRLKRDHNIDMIVVDYLQLLRGGDNWERREQEVAYISRSLKAIAKELDIPVVACAQLNRQIEQRGKEKKPQLADLRESGAIEQDADVVIFVYRPALSEKFDKDDPDYETKIRKTNIIVGKQRNGPTDDFELMFQPQFTRFDNIKETTAEEILLPSELESTEDLSF